jgi:hypothetical protein
MVLRGLLVAARVIRYQLFATSAFGQTRRGEANPSFGGSVIWALRELSVAARVIGTLRGLSVISLGVGGRLLDTLSRSVALSSFSR